MYNVYEAKVFAAAKIKMTAFSSQMMRQNETNAKMR
jgi:hypothetical protein